MDRTRRQLRRGDITLIVLSSALLALARAQNASIYSNPSNSSATSGVKDASIASGIAVSPPAPPWKNGASSTIYSLQTAAKALTGTTIRCADYIVLRDNKTLGDGFFRIDPSSSSTINRILSAPTNNTAVKIEASVVSGMNPWMLNKLATLGNFTVEFYVVRISDDLYKSSDKTLAILHLLNQGFDCVLSASQVLEARLPYMNFLSGGLQPYSYWVVSEKATPFVMTTTQRLWKWTSPFTPEVWGIMMAILVAVGVSMWYLERKANPEDFGDYRTLPTPYQIWHGVYLAFAGFASKTEEYSPKTVSGRVLGLVNAFVMWLVLSFYIANLAAVLSSDNPPLQVIKSIQDFESLNLPCCIPSKSAYIDWMKLNYPGIKLIPVGPNPNDLLDALMAKRCFGGVSVDVSLLYLLGVGDVNATYCNLEMVGLGLNFGYYAMPFTTRFTYDQMAAFNSLAQMAIEDGSYLHGAVEESITRERHSCDIANAIREVALLAYPQVGDPLDLSMFAGLFVVQVLGIGLAFGIRFFSRSARVVKACRNRGHDDEEEGAVNGDANGDGSVEGGDGARPKRGWWARAKQRKKVETHSQQLDKQIAAIETLQQLLYELQHKREVVRAGGFTSEGKWKLAKSTVGKMKLAAQLGAHVTPSKEKLEKKDGEAGEEGSVTKYQRSVLKAFGAGKAPPDAHPV